MKSGILDLESGILPNEFGIPGTNDYNPETNFH